MPIVSPWALPAVPERVGDCVGIGWGRNMSRVKAFLIGAASGLVEPFAVLCAWLVSLAEVLLPLGLAQPLEQYCWW